VFSFAGRNVLETGRAIKPCVGAFVALAHGGKAAPRRSDVRDSIRAVARSPVGLLHAPILAAAVAKTAFRSSSMLCRYEADRNVLAPAALHRYLAGRRVRRLNGNTSCGLCGTQDLRDVQGPPMRV